MSGEGDWYCRKILLAAGIPLHTNCSVRCRQLNPINSIFQIILELQKSSLKNSHNSCQHSNTVSGSHPEMALFELLFSLLVG